jgi:hypothetical protein
MLSDLISVFTNSETITLTLQSLGHFKFTRFRIGPITQSQKVEMRVNIRAEEKGSSLKTVMSELC